MAVLMVGLPGSGKTHHAQQLAAQGWVMVDDITSMDDLPEHHPDLRVVITDPRFCITAVRDAAVTQCGARYDHVTVQFFENNPQACLRNIEHRADGRRVCNFVHQLHKLYEIPSGAVCMQIWQPDHI